ncbi:helix-turn-helix domain-containing protein [Streptomyces thermolilacinus]
MIKGGLPPLGLGEAEERAYEALLLERAERVEELARLLGLPRERVDTALDRLVEHGFAHPADPAEGGGLPHPAAPAAAIRTLIDRRQAELHRRAAELDRLRLTAERLAARRAGGAGGGCAVEVVTGRGAADERTARLLAGAEREVLLMDRAPYGGVGAGLDVGGLLARGVEVRAVLDRAGLVSPARARTVAALARQGLRVRVAAGVPTRLVAVDRRVTLLPPSDPADPRPHALVVSDPRLLEALLPLFDLAWTRSAPWGDGHRDGHREGDARHAGDDHREGDARGAGDGHREGRPCACGEAQARAGDGDLDRDRAGEGGRDRDRAGEGGADGCPEQRELLRLLAAGLKDEAIARRLGVHVHTARRRISRLLESLDARTRFQAGARATARGWLDTW